MMSNEEISQRLRELGVSHPEINATNRMYALAIIYNHEMDESMSENETNPNNEELMNNSVKQDVRLFSPKTTCQLNWDQYWENTKEDIDSGVRYAITQWEGDQNDILVEFKRMRLSYNATDDDIMLEAEHIMKKILDQVSKHGPQRQILLQWDNIDEHELFRLSEMYEKQYYGYASDNELVQAIEELMITTDTSTDTTDMYRQKYKR